MRGFAVLFVLLSAACADEIPEDVSAQMEAARTASQTPADTTEAPDVDELIVNAPPGGHATWIRDIRTGLDSVPATAAVDRGEALYEVQEFYARRFEPLRRFYGPGGAIDAGPAVSQAVARADAQLQQLMQHLAGEEADEMLIEAAVRASHESLQQIEDAARAAGLQPTAPRDGITTGS